MDGPQAGQQVSISQRRVRVGRSEAADFRIEHPSLSGLHFELRIRRDGVDLFDLASKNGTMLMGRRVFHARVELGDIIVAGDCGIKFIDSAEIEVEHSPEAREDGLYGISPAIQEAFAAIDAAAACDLPTLILGETGTGKELAARAVHRRSARRRGPFIVLDCSTLPVGLAESAILGHAKGAFTNASRDRAGAFEEASGGTIFLDEIGELRQDVQARLLRVLGGGEVVRVGETTPRPVDVRVLAATHRDLVAMVDAGEFRLDLLHRLDGHRVEMPSLRERGPEEIEYLARAILERVSGGGKARLQFSRDAVSALRRHDWPGNVRELENVVRRAATLRSEGEVMAEDFSVIRSPSIGERLEELARFGSYDEAHAMLDRYLLPRLVEECGGDLEEVARRLGSRDAAALRSRMEQVNCVPPG